MKDFMVSPHWQQKVPISKKILLIIQGITVYSFAWSQSVTYTCPMHLEIHSANPGICPKCKMKLVKEKTKAVSKPKIKKQVEKQVPADKSKKADSIEQIQITDSTHHKHDKVLEPVKTINNNTPPQTVRYDIYLRYTIVNFSGKPKRAIEANGLA